MCDTEPTADAASKIDHQFDPRRTDPVDAVFRAVQRVEHVDLTEATPLASVVDPDALDTLFQCETQDREITVFFQYEGLDIQLSSTGHVTVRQRDGSGCRPS